MLHSGAVAANSTSRTLLKLMAQSDAPRTGYYGAPNPINRQAASSCSILQPACLRKVKQDDSEGSVDSLDEHVPRIRLASVMYIAMDDSCAVYGVYGPNYRVCLIQSIGNTYYLRERVLTSPQICPSSVPIRFPYSKGVSPRISSMICPTTCSPGGTSNCAPSAICGVTSGRDTHRIKTKRVWDDVALQRLHPLVSPPFPLCQHRTAHPCHSIVF